MGWKNASGKDPCAASRYATEVVLRILMSCGACLRCGRHVWKYLQWPI